MNDPTKKKKVKCINLFPDTVEGINKERKGTVMNFSQMIDILVQEALTERNKKNK